MLIINSDASAKYIFLNRIETTLRGDENFLSLCNRTEKSLITFKSMAGDEHTIPWTKTHDPQPRDQIREITKFDADNIKPYPYSPQTILAAKTIAGLKANLEKACGYSANQVSFTGLDFDQKPPVISIAISDLLSDDLNRWIDALHKHWSEDSNTLTKEGQTYLNMALQKYGIGNVLHHLVSLADKEKNILILKHLITISRYTCFDPKSEIRKHIWMVVWNRKRPDKHNITNTMRDAMREDIDSLFLHCHLLSPEEVCLDTWNPHKRSAQKTTWAEFQANTDKLTQPHHIPKNFKKKFIHALGPIIDYFHAQGVEISIITNYLKKVFSGSKSYPQALTQALQNFKNSASQQTGHTANNRPQEHTFFKEKNGIHQQDPSNPPKRMKNHHN